MRTPPLTGPTKKHTISDLEAAALPPLVPRVHRRVGVEDGARHPAVHAEVHEARDPEDAAASRVERARLAVHPGGHRGRRAAGRVAPWGRRADLLGRNGSGQAGMCSATPEPSQILSFLVRTRTWYVKGPFCTTPCLNDTYDR